MAPQYFDGEYLTDDAILTPELLKQCTLTTTALRPIPKTLNMKDSDQFDYYTKNLKPVYPGTSGSTSMIIPNVAIHCETFDHFGKTGVFVGVPQSQFVDPVRTKLLSQNHRPVFEETALASDEHYWWVRFGSLPAEKDKEFIFVVEEDEETGDLVETPYESFTALFNDLGSSVLCNITCAVKMTAKTPVDRKGAITAQDEWKMGLNITRVNVIDLIDVEKPRTTLTQKSLAGNKDKASSKLMAKLRQKRQNGI